MRVIVLSLLLSSAALAQNRDTLETKVSGDGSAIVFQWSTKHPWDAELQAGKAFLAAEYRTVAGRVELDCLDAAAAPDPLTAARYRMRGAGCAGIMGVALGGRENGTLQFKLPDELTGVPAGPVCLFLRMPNLRVIPIRKADKSAGDTSRFQYEPWSGPAGKRAIATAAQSRVAALRQALTQAAKNVHAQQEINKGRGWESMASCLSAKAPELNMMEGNTPIAASPEHDQLARRICVLQLRNSGQIMQRRIKALQQAGKLSADSVEEQMIVTIDGYRTERGPANMVYSPAVLEFLLAKVPEAANDPRFASRMAQLRELSADWSRWAAATEDYLKRYPVPHFGEADRYMDLQSHTAVVGQRIATALRAKQSPAAVDVRGFVGASLEAWNRCVVEGKAQMETSYQRHVQLRERTPVLQESVRRDTIRACEAGFNKLEELKATQARFEADLNQAEAKLSETSVVSAGPVARQTALNGAGCVAQ